LPPVAFVQRREVRIPPQKTAAALNVRPVERIAPHEAPEQPRQGDTPARAARMPIAVFQSIASIRAVMQDDFQFTIFAPYPGAQALGGRQAPWNERLNVQRSPAEAYGSLVSINPVAYGGTIW
jgi:hypothetical protein